VALPGLPKGRTPVAAAVERIIKAGLNEGLLSLSSPTLAHMENPYRDIQQKAVTNDSAHSSIHRPSRSARPATARPCTAPSAGWSPAWRPGPTGKRSWPRGGGSSRAGRAAAPAGRMRSAPRSARSAAPRPRPRTTCEDLPCRARRPRRQRSDQTARHQW
jgi:hypothetical protein